MNKQEKENILVFARNGFREFYTSNSRFLTELNYKPGKRTYRNLLSLNKMMQCYIDAGHDYVKKEEVIKKMKWRGPSSYVQHERIITNFGLSDTSWQDRDREVLLLSDAGKKLRDKYKNYIKNTGTDLATLNELPKFAIDYIIDQISKTTASSMTLWKNTIITALYLYACLGYIPHYSSSTSSVKPEEAKALKECLNYVNEYGNLQDITYTDQPIAMLKNLRLIDDKGHLSSAGYNLLKSMTILSEMDTSYSEYADFFGDQLSEAANILLDKTIATKVDAPERKERKVIVQTSSGSRAINRNFEKETETSNKIGKLGEQLALSYERKRLKDLGVENVEDVVFLTSESAEYGNAYPCDMISIDETSGKKTFIEVKSTRGSISASFYISKEELQFSEEHKEHYKLYRFYNVMKKATIPEFYETTGYVGDNFTLICDRYIATRDIITDNDE